MRLVKVTVALLERGRNLEDPRPHLRLRVQTGGSSELIRRAKHERMREE